MTPTQITYLVFGIVLLLAIVFDLGLLSKKSATLTTGQALKQTIFWVILALGFGAFMWYEDGKQAALEYVSAYLMEWSLSIDNIFVFVLIFSFFKVKEQYIPRVLLIGVLMAILFRVVFITLGVELVNRFHWILYIFGAFLVYTGFKMFTTNQEEEFDPKESSVYLFLKKFLPITMEDGHGKYRIKQHGKPVYTALFVVVVMLATTDIVFALDSIPAVMGIVDRKSDHAALVIYTSNVFAVLGLRSLFFLLRGAVSKFDFLQQGIAIVLVFIGIKMLGEELIGTVIDKPSQVILSLVVIVACIGGSILYSIYHKKKGTPPNRP
ncbi:tellurite resistance protein TerC [Lacibacter cauensis]|uniref:Tellurite resistance protein TerC n=1 Tax=Lacibacter cauensis TaxID=510947 RepID=A0A562SJU7_9BACT|nr:TerC/Alx family metal homeostasis membrane protein [Lacibacter cauensis]TWI81264.1 tellurite resistance protein TerC [Lacibacter cauensis]